MERVGRRRHGSARAGFIQTIGLISTLCAKKLGRDAEGDCIRAIRGTNHTR
jgi:hypothetical protein